MRKTDGNKSSGSSAALLEPRHIIMKLAGRISRVKPKHWLLLTLFCLAVFFILSPKSLLFTVLWAIFSRKIAVFMLAAFGLIALSLVWTTGERIDEWIFKFINSRGNRPLWLDRLMLGATQAGNGVFAYSLAFILFLLAKHLIAYELVFGNLTLWLMVEIIKVIVRRARPYSSLQSIRVVGYKAGGASFPSGHTSQAFFMASLFAHYFRPGFIPTLLLYVIAASVGITRMYVGMHYPRDVLGGAILGTTWGVIGLIINSYIFSELNLS